MKKNLIYTLALFFLSVVANTFHRLFTSAEIIYPFYADKTIGISVAWHAKFICESISFSLLMICIYRILKPVENHLKIAEWPKHQAFYIFVNVWRKIFAVVTITALLDILNYIYSYKQSENFFLIQNGVFFILTSYYLYKAYHKK